MLKLICAGVVMAFAIFALADAPATQPAATQQAATQPAATQPGADRIAALIGQMGDRKFPVRQQAQKALVLIGPSAEPALREAAAHSTVAEIRRRALAAIDRIENNLPDSPSLVAVNAKQESPAKVLASMAEQAGVSIAPHNADFWDDNNGEGGNGTPGGKPITLSLGRVPLLVALEKFCKATQTRPQTNGSTDDVFELVRMPSGVWDQQDRMAVIANMITQTRQIDLSTNANSRTDDLGLTFLVDPKRPLVDHQPPQVTRAEDENGVSLVGSPAEQPQGTMGNALQGECSFDADIALNIPAQRGKMIARLQGTIVLRVATNIQAMVVPDLAKAVKKPGVTVCQRKLEVVSFTFTGGSGNVSLRVTNTMPQAEISALENKGQAVDLGGEFRSFRMVDAHGTPLWFDSSGSDSGDKQLNWSGHFTVNNSPPLKPPFSLRWDIVATSKDITVPFEFKNLPLPAQ